MSPPSDSSGQIITADVNTHDFDDQQRFDRILSIEVSFIRLLPSFMCIIVPDV